jgi:hypothetical protein
MREERVAFSGLIPFAGLVGGVVLAVALPYVTLKYGAGLSSAAQTGIIILALLIGGAVTFSSAFFGIVIPRRVYEGSERGEERRQP